MNPHLDPSGENTSPEEKLFDKALRPEKLNDFSGQDKLVENLSIFIAAANLRGDSLDHVILHGPPGLGKTTLAYIIAHELGCELKSTSGPVLEIGRASCRERLEAEEV